MKRRRTRDDARRERRRRARGDARGARVARGEREADSAAKEATTLRERCALLERNAERLERALEEAKEEAKEAERPEAKEAGRPEAKERRGDRRRRGNPRGGETGDEGGGEIAAGSKSLRQLRVSLRQLRPRFRVVRRGDARVGVRRRARRRGWISTRLGSRVANDGYSRRNAWTPLGVSTPPSPTREETRRRPSRLR